MFDKYFSFLLIHILFIKMIFYFIINFTINIIQYPIANIFVVLNFIFSIFQLFNFKSFIIRQNNDINEIKLYGLGFNIGIKIMAIKINNIYKYFICDINYFFIVGLFNVEILSG